MKIRRGVGLAFVGTGLLVLSCGADHASVPVVDAGVSTASAEAVVESGAAATRIAELRARFRLLGAPVATRFEAAPDAAAYVRAVLPADALRGVSRAAHVALPVRADGEVKLEDDTSHVSVGFVLEHVRDAHIEIAGGMAVYRGALDGADVVHRVHAEGTEDFVVFETRPPREELSYSVDVSRVPGLRLVSNTLEFLDEGGTPVLRVAPPWVVDAAGARHEAKLAVAGCAYDANPAGPWGRAMRSPPAARCNVNVKWTGVEYPVLVDPAWGATGSLVVARSSHTANVLPSGKVFVAGGNNPSFGYDLASAELYDPLGNGGTGTFAATGSMSVGRAGHTATLLASGRVLAVGGVAIINSTTTYLASAEAYDVGTGTFGPTGSMAGGARFSHTASRLASGKVLVAGGFKTYAGPAISSAELFDPTANAGVGAFTATGAMAVARANHTASVLPSGKVLAAGGCASGGGICSVLASAELFDPTGNAGVGAFATTGTLATGRQYATESVLPSGKVLIAGGYGAGGQAELFDPAANGGVGAFKATGAMAARYAHTATVLPSGKVLLTGGFDTDVLASAEVFDPAGNAGAGTFAPTASLAAPRSMATATLLASGKVLVAGGSAATQIASAELFGGGLGDACVAGSFCISGFCVDSVCCDSACNAGGCDRCDLTGKAGTCSLAPSGDPGTSAPCAFPLACDGVNAACPASCGSDAACAEAYYCAPNGTCLPRKAQGSACNGQVACKQPACRECVSGLCEDGVCCDTACAGQCEACDSVPGTCRPVSGKPHGGRPGCPPGNACSATTNRCEVGTATCDGDHTTTGADGTKQNCAPYRCADDGTCRLLCASVNDCVAPTVCDGTGKCVAASADGGAGGCAVGVLGATDDRSGLVWVALALGMLAKHTRAPRRKEMKR